MDGVLCELGGSTDAQDCSHSMVGSLGPVDSSRSAVHVTHLLADVLITSFLSHSTKVRRFMRIDKAERRAQNMHPREPLPYSRYAKREKDVMGHLPDFPSQSDEMAA